MTATLIEDPTSQLRDWWYRAMTDPNPAGRAEAFEHLRAFKEAPVAHSPEERLELAITESILTFIEENFHPAQEECSCSEDSVPSALRW